MAQIPCPECNRRISETAESCPKCGCKLTPEKIEEAKKKDKRITTEVAIGCLTPFVIVLGIYMCSQVSPTPRRSHAPTQQKSPTSRGLPTAPAWQQKLWQETPGYDANAGTLHYKNKYREARRAYETAKSNYDRNPSPSNKRAWDDATTMVDFRIN